MTTAILIYLAIGLLTLFCDWVKYGPYSHAGGGLVILVALFLWPVYLGSQILGWWMMRR